MKRAVISSSATGGHFYPAYALADRLIKENWEILFAIKKGDFAAEFLRQKNIAFVELDIKPFPRSVDLFKHLSFWYNLNRSIKFAGNIMKDLNPNIVVSTGGYVSFPVVVSANLSKLPVLIHEQNAKMGLANRIASRLAGKVALGLPVEKPKGKKFVLTATPVREEFAVCLTKKEAREKLGLPADKKIIVVFGGSGGARALNEAIITVIKKINRQAPQSNVCKIPPTPFNKGGVRGIFAHFHFLHITGKRDYEYAKNLYDQVPENVKLLNYCNQMNEVLQCADLVISRAGAGTISELLVTHTPAVLVPFPHATANHQYYNAKILADAGAAVIVKEDKNLTINLTKKIKELFVDAFQPMSFQANAKQSLPSVIATPSTTLRGKQSTLQLIKMQNAYNTLALPNPLNAADKLLEIVQILAK